SGITRRRERRGRTSARRRNAARRRRRRTRAEHHHLEQPFRRQLPRRLAGRTLYTYGADWAGDCNYAPISNCVTDCLVAWPLFNANPRTLAPTLDDHAFGTILRADGAYQTTYFGWPLYYYKTDTGPGVLGGQAKAKT